MPLHPLGSVKNMCYYGGGGNKKSAIANCEFTLNFCNTRPGKVCEEMGAHNPCQLGHMHTTLRGRIKAIWPAQELLAVPLKAVDQRKRGGLVLPHTEPGGRHIAEMPRAAGGCRG